MTDTTLTYENIVKGVFATISLNNNPFYFNIFFFSQKLTNLKLSNIFSK